jgi:hypothetical protein
MNLKFEYKIVFENNLRHESWDRMGVFDEKTKFKNLMQVYLQGAATGGPKGQKASFRKIPFHVTLNKSQRHDFEAESEVIFVYILAAV